MGIGEFLESWRSFPSFEDWWALYSSAMNKRTLVALLAKKHLSLLIEFLNRPTTKEGKNLPDEEKIIVLQTLIRQPTFLTSIHDVNAFAASLRPAGTALLARALNTEDIIKAFVLGMNLKADNYFKSLYDLFYFKNLYDFFEGLGTNVRIFFGTLGPHNVSLGRALRDIRALYGKILFGGSGLCFSLTMLMSRLQPRLRDVLDGLGSHIEAFFGNNLPAIILESGEDARVFGELMKDRLGPFADTIVKDATHNSRSITSLTALFIGLEKYIEQFVEMVDVSTIKTHGQLLHRVNHSYTQYLAAGLRKVPLKATAFGSANRYSDESFATFLRDSPRFMSDLGPAALPFLEGFLGEHPRPGEGDRLFIALGASSQTFVLSLPPAAQTFFLRSLSTEHVQPGMLGALQCPYCRSVIGGTDTVLRCFKCGTFLHNSCAAENGNHCPTLGCTGPLLAIPRKKTPPRPNEEGKVP